MIINLILPTLKQNEHPEQYEDVAKFIHMGNWLVDEVDKKTKIRFLCSIRIKLHIIETYLCKFWKVCFKNM